jgi:hypothetical protein
MWATCKGDDALGAPCDDKNECSVDDKCIPLPNPSVAGGNLFCRGVPSGLPCDDTNVCTDEDKCIEVPRTWGIHETSIVCRGEVVVGRPCDDFMDCTVNDVCYKHDRDFSRCFGTPATC